MRLITRKIYRAFPELDKFSDEQCRQFVKAASRGWVRFGLRAALMTAWFLLVTSGIIFGVFYTYTWLDLDAPESGWFYALTLGPIVVALCIGFLTMLILGDLLLRRRIGKVLNTRGRCHGCRYILLGLPVSADLKVRCPECGEDVEVDLSLGELVTDETGARQFRPKDDQLDPVVMARMAARRRVWIRRCAIAAGFVIGVPALVVGWWFLDIELQARRAAHSRVTFAEWMAVAEKVYPVDPHTDSEQQWAMLGRVGGQARAVEAGVVKSIEAQAGEGVYPSVAGIADTKPLSFLTPEAAADEQRQRKYSRMAAVDAVEQLRKAGWMDQSKELLSVRPVHWPNPPAGTELISGVKSPGLLGERRAIARINVARMQLAYEAGDVDEYVAALREIFAVGRSCATEPTLIGLLVGSSAEGTAYNAVQRHLIHVPSEAWLKEVESVLEQHQPVSILPLFDAHVLMMRDEICAYFSDARQVRLARLRRENAQGTPDLAERPSDQIIGSLEENLVEAESYAAVCKQRYATEPWKETQTAPKSQRNDLALLHSVFPFSERIEFILDESTTKNRGLRTMIMLEKHRLAHGRYPESLSDLVAAGKLPEACTDPFSGKPFGYRTIDPAQDVLQRGYLLWSVGADREDNSGAQHKRGPNWNRDALRLKDEQFDYIINQPE